MSTLIISRIYLGLLIAAAFLVLRFIRSTLQWRARTRGLPLPPGPKPLPIIGNLFNIPTRYVSKAYRDMAQQYGDLIHLSVLGQHVVVVGSMEAAHELLDKKAANTSDRPMQLISSLVGIDWILSLVPYGPSWRIRRRLFWQYFQPEANKKYLPIQREECRRFLERLLDGSADLVDEINFVFGSSVMRSVYNIQLQHPHDSIITALETGMEAVAQSIAPGSSLVELFPAIRFLPSWLPFQRRMARWRRFSLDIKELPFSQAQPAPADAMVIPVVQLLKERLHDSKEVPQDQRDEVIKDVAGVAYAGESQHIPLCAAETSRSTLQSFFLAMSLYPEIQKKAQAEIDLVVGTGRLPESVDEEQLPYVRALIKEVLRWLPVLPIGVPHATVEDDECNGYFIPAGTAIIANVWGMTHDPTVYPEPEQFMPERFLKDGELDPSVRDPESIIFGFGRRICPGRHFANTSLFINVASVLAVYDITPPLDANGRPIRIQLRVTDGALAHPEDLRCTIRPRSEEARRLILEGVPSEKAYA